MDEKVGIAELLAVRAMDGGSGGFGKYGAVWAIFIIILVAAVIWLVGGRRFGHRGDGEEDEHRGCIKDMIDAEFFRRKIVCKEELEDEIDEVCKDAEKADACVFEKAKAYADKEDFKLVHEIDKRFCKDEKEIEKLEFIKVNKEFKKVAFCPEDLCGGNTNPVITGVVTPPA